MWHLAIVVVLLGLASPARADWPCADNVRYRVARSAKGDKPIAIAAGRDKAVYGDFTFVELNNDGKPDIVFRSACIQGVGERTRLHQVYASCGPAADGIEELVQLFEQEEPCARAVALATQAHQSKAAGVLWQDLELVRTTPGKRCEQAVEPLAFDGTRYQSGASSTRPCPKPR